MFTPPSGARARSPMLCILLLVAVALGACHPQPQPPAPGGPAVTVGSWTDTARTVVETLRWAIPAARAVVDAVVPAPAVALVDRALDAVADWNGRLATALDAYVARGGDACLAHAAVGGLRSALVSLAQVLADHGLAIGVPIERVVDAVASVADALVPRCQGDAGWSSAGDHDNAELRAIATRAAARGVVLRRDLDNIRPAGAQ